MVNVELVNPGCFGFVITYSENLRICRDCPAHDTCASISLERRRQLEKLLDISAFTASRTNADSASDTHVEVNQITNESTVKSRADNQVSDNRSAEKKVRRTDPGVLPVKIAELNDRLLRKGVDLTTVKQGVNPLSDGKPEFLHVVVELLLTKNAVRRDEVVTELMTRLNWKETSAKSHASICYSLLTYYGVATMTQDNHYRRVTE